MRETTPPGSGLVLDDATVATVIAALYGRRIATMQRLNSEHATVCHFTTTAGEDLVLKAMSPRHTDPLLARWQAAAIDRLGREGLPVPHLVATQHGHTVADWEHDGETIHVQVSTWIVGRPLAHIVPALATMRSVGATAARMSVALAGYDTPPPGPGHVWELGRTARTLDSVLDQIADPMTRDLLARASAEFTEHVAPRMSNLPRGIVHHDLNDYNVLVEPDGREPLVSAVLDFGDMVEGVRVAELTTAAAYVSRLSPDPGRALAEVARGWLEVAPLTADELAVLRAAALARLAVNLGVWTARLGSDRGEYAGERRGSSATALAALLETEQDEFTATLGAVAESASTGR